MNHGLRRLCQSGSRSGSSWARSLSFLVGLDVVAEFEPAFGGFQVEAIGWFKRLHHNFGLGGCARAPPSARILPGGRADVNALCCQGGSPLGQVLPREGHFASKFLSAVSMVFVEISPIYTSAVRGFGHRPQSFQPRLHRGFGVNPLQGIARTLAHG